MWLPKLKKSNIDLSGFKQHVKGENVNKWLLDNQGAVKCLLPIFINSPKILAAHW